MSQSLHTEYATAAIEFELHGQWEFAMRHYFMAAREAAEPEARQRMLKAMVRCHDEGMGL